MHCAPYGTQMDLRMSLKWRQRCKFRSAWSLILFFAFISKSLLFFGKNQIKLTETKHIWPCSSRSARPVKAKEWKSYSNGYFFVMLWYVLFLLGVCCKCSEKGLYLGWTHRHESIPTKHKIRLATILLSANFFFANFQKSTYNKCKTIKSAQIQFLGKQISTERNITGVEYARNSEYRF